MDGSRPVSRDDDEASDLGEALDRLKQTGCNVLVTGTAAEAQVAISRKLFGHTRQRRRRVLISPDTDASADRWLPEGVSVTDPDTELLAPPVADRSAATAVSSPAPDTSRALQTLRNDLSDVVSTYQSDRLAPGEVRVGIQSADVLASHYGRDELLGFVRTATALIRGVRGMGHLQLGQPHDGDLTPLLWDLFDARVDVRQQPGLPPEQRWHVPGHGTTEWIGIAE
jgi:hypothetical protein